MPLYKKALRLTPEKLGKMTFDECYELLLFFRYLQFRKDESLSSEEMESRMDQIKNRLRELNPELGNKLQ
jgi:hypothetical protein